MSTLTLETLLAAVRRIEEELGPPPPEVRFSRHATGLPTGEPHTDDMRQMVERIGQQRVPAAYSFRDGKREVIFIHPDLMK